MSLLDGILDKMQLNADYDDEEYDVYDEDEYEDEGFGESLFGKIFGNKEKKEVETKKADPNDRVEKKVIRSESRREQSGFWSVKGSKNRNGANEVCIIAPKSYSEVAEIVDTLLSSKVVVLNIEGISLDEAQRITDFVFGAVYAMGGTNFQISSNIFVCAPFGNDIYDGVNDEDTYSTDLTGLRKVN